MCTICLDYIKEKDSIRRLPGIIHVFAPRLPSIQQAVSYICAARLRNSFHVGITGFMGSALFNEGVRYWIAVGALRACVCPFKIMFI